MIFVLFLLSVSEVKGKLTELLDKLKKVPAWEVKIVEDIYDPSFGKVARREGIFVFRRPLKFLLEYDDGQKIVSDGKKVWFFHPIKRKVYVQPVTLIFEKNFVLAILSASEKIFEVFDVFGKSDNVLLLKPKKGDAISSIKIFLRSKGFFPFSKIIVRADKLEFRINFVKFSSSARKIELEIPQGWDIISAP